MAIKIPKGQEVQNLHKSFQPFSDEGGESFVLGEYDPDVLVVL